jgi:hypothetical protein
MHKSSLAVATARLLLLEEREENAIKYAGRISPI